MALRATLVVLAALIVVSVAWRGDEQTIFRPPAVPIVTFAPMHQKFILNSMPSDGSQLPQYWDGSFMDMNVLLVAVNSTGEVMAGFQMLGSNWLSGLPYAPCVGFPKVDPLTTTFEYSIQVASENSVSVRLSFLHTLFAANETLLSRPIVYAEVTVDYPSSGSLQGVQFQAYLDMSSQNCVGLGDEENITWSTEPQTRGNVTYIRMGTEKQAVMDYCGDDFMLNWGYLYLAAGAQDGSVTGGSGPEIRKAFGATGKLQSISPLTPQPAFLGAQVIAVSATITSTSPSTHFLIGYDEVSVQYYFGQLLTGRWQRATPSCSDFACLLNVAESDFATVRSKVIAFDDALMQQMTSTISANYAKIGALAYRQTLAAIELTYNPKYDENWAFLKEISSDGDINTMDVIFPASPHLFFFNPRLVKQLLLPVLHYGNNDTWHPYGLPFSPHQLGTYPIANITTSEQEIMPSENTGNMMIMLLAYMKATNGTDAFFYPKYWPMLTSWAQYLIQTQLPIPPKQICTDDFAGPLNENTNLAAKGMIALHAYADLCDMVKEHFCDTYRDLSVSYAEYWVSFAIETDSATGINHSKLAYDMPHTWSTKYNFLWQKLLKMDGPFKNYNDLARNEVQFYKTQFNRFGFPMDIRHTYQKLDWMTWGSLLSNETSEFAYLFDGVFRMANETTSRWPLTDLYDTVSADIVLSFRARPVVGAIFAAMMVFGQGPWNF
jgi:hypothetical protein